MLLAAVLVSVVLTPLPAPDFKTAPVKTIVAKAPITLRLVSSGATSITDTDAWFRKHELSLNESEQLPAEWEGLKLVTGIRSDGRLLRIYGPDYAGGTIVVGDGFAYDFSAYRFAPRNIEKDLEFVEQRVLWAELRGPVLYVSHGHRTYAKSSHGMNAYVSAIDTRTGKPLWHSAPLVANATNVTFLGDRYLVTGYGFTAEPDFLYLLRAKDGAAVAKVPLKSGPTHILTRGRRLYVRTYDHEYVFSMP